MKAEIIALHSNSGAVVRSSTGVPYLATKILQGANNFSRVADDKGSDAKMDVTVFRPLPEDGYFYLGEVAVGHYTDSFPSACLVVRPMNDPDDLCLRKPDGFARIWQHDDPNHGKLSFSFWQPVSNKSGYHGIGLVFFVSKDKNAQPNVRDYPALRLVRSDLTQLASPDEQLIWDDKGTGARQNSSLFALPYSRYFISSSGPDGQYPSDKFADIIKPTAA